MIFVEHRGTPTHLRCTRNTTLDVVTQLDMLRSTQNTREMGKSAGSRFLKESKQNTGGKRFVGIITFENVTSVVVVECINHIKSRSLKHREFHTFLKEIK